MSTELVAIQYFLVAVGLISFCANTYAGDGNGLLANGSAVEAFIDSGDVPEGKEISIGVCFGLIEGIKAMTHLAHGIGHKGILNICWPNDTAIINGQAVRVVLSYLRKNPQDLHTDQSYLVLSAYRDAYACSD